jgi:putative oxidoreductase
MKSIALLLLRVTTGGLLAGHGAQKLFGSFGGGGIRATSGFMESLGLRPGKPWANLAGLSELGGGVLTVLGFLSPVGPLASMGAMVMAWVTAHRGKPIWSAAGGAELPLTNLSVLSALALAGPGRLSIDGLLGTRHSRFLLVPGLAAIAATAAFAMRAGDAASGDAEGTDAEGTDAEGTDAEGTDAGAVSAPGGDGAPDLPAPGDDLEVQGPGDVVQSDLVGMAALSAEYTQDHAAQATDAAPGEVEAAWEAAAEDSLAAEPVRDADTA